jgi:hypothetical protein
MRPGCVAAARSSRLALLRARSSHGAGARHRQPRCAQLRATARSRSGLALSRPPLRRRFGDRARRGREALPLAALDLVAGDTALADRCGGGGGRPGPAGRRLGGDRLRWLERLSPPVAPAHEGGGGTELLACWPVTRGSWRGDPPYRPVGGGYRRGRGGCRAGAGRGSALVRRRRRRGAYRDAGAVAPLPRPTLRADRSRAPPPVGPLVRAARVLGHADRALQWQRVADVLRPRGLSRDRASSPAPSASAGAARRPGLAATGRVLPLS